ncbi:MAG: hypothetical protein H0V81_16195 [Solirubrobacterales bacterium]|nr:hypothetical protein [Solirubrobacterales bacterium]
MAAASDLALVQGMAHTRTTLRAWSREPWQVLRGWLLGALAITTVLLLAVWLIGSWLTPDASLAPTFPGLTGRADLGTVGEVLMRNALVLALHGFACVAGFIAGSSLPLQAEQHSGLYRKIHDRAGPLAIAFVVAATSFSLLTQALSLGFGAANLAARGDMSVGLLLVGLLPHALPELVALFLPLAAWVIASRREDWHELLAATFVTVGLAIPVLIAASFVEVYISADVILWLRG